MPHRSKRPDDQNAILNRLKSADGHLRAVIGMLETGVPCEEVLHQLGAVEAALDAAGRALRFCQFQESLERIRHGVSAEARLAELRRLATLYGLEASLHVSERMTHE